MKKGKVSIPLTCLTPPHYCVSPTKQGLRFSTPYVAIVAFLCVQLFQLNILVNGIMTRFITTHKFSIRHETNFQVLDTN